MFQQDTGGAQADAGGSRDCDPFVCENGAAIFVPRGYFGFDVPNARDVAGYKAVEFGRSYEEVVIALRQAAGRLGAHVIGFSDMSVEEVARDCDLPLLQARLAKLREYSELFRVLDCDSWGNVRLLRSLRNAGLDCVYRGRFYHLGAVRRETAAQFLSGLYRCACGPLLTTVGFADSSPAMPMLHGMDLPLILQREITPGDGESAGECAVRTLDDREFTCRVCRNRPRYRPRCPRSQPVLRLDLPLSDRFVAGRFEATCRYQRQKNASCPTALEAESGIPLVPSGARKDRRRAQEVRSCGERVIVSDA